MTDAEVRALAAYYDALPPASNAVVPPNLKREDGQWLALYGDWPNRRLPACQQCHGPLGIGAGADFPALAGQPYSYLVNQMANWGTGDRGGDHDGMMRAVAEKLSMAEAQRVAAFYASLPAQKVVEVAAAIASGERVPSAADLTPPDQGAAAQAPRDAESEQRRWAPMPHRGAAIDHQGPTPAGRDLAKGASYFQPPSRTERPKDEFGEMVAMGESIFSNTYSHEVSGKYVGNTQVCEGCHLDAGRLAGASPLWAARINYPAYRKKNDQVNTLVERVQGCFRYSMNAPASEVGTVPSAESRTVRALLSYMHWLATGAPVGDKDIPGRGIRSWRRPPTASTPSAAPSSMPSTAPSATVRMARAATPARRWSSRRSGASIPTIGAPACTASTTPPPTSRPTCRSATTWRSPTNRPGTSPPS